MDVCPDLRFQADLEMGRQVGKPAMLLFFLVFATLGVLRSIE